MFRSHRRNEVSSVSSVGRKNKKRRQTPSKRRLLLESLKTGGC